MSIWEMRRIESPTESPCCALVLEVGEYKATVYFVPESQTWSVDVMQGERLIYRNNGLALRSALNLADFTLDSPE